MKNFRKKRPICISLVAMIVFVAIYVFFLKKSDNPNVISDVVITILGIIAGVAFWLEYHHNGKLNEAEFIVELNKQFVLDKNMTDVEHDLELYFALVRGEPEIGRSKEEYENEFSKKYNIKNDKRQNLVNYLVHLEGVATLISSDVIKISTINNLMAYRFFIAVNNPVVQEIEIFPYAEYYKGLFELFKNWKDYKNMSEDMPLKDTLLDKRYEDYIKKSKQIESEGKDGNR